MAFNDIERQRCERDIAKFMERHRPPPHIRPELDFGLAKPGENITSISLMAAKSNGKSVELFRDILPSVQRVGVLGDATNPVMRNRWLTKFNSRLGERRGLRAG